MRKRALAMALPLLLILLVPATQAHIAGQSQLRDFSRVVHDCKDDYGWHGNTADKGHDHAALEMAEEEVDGQMLVIFQLVITKDIEPKPARMEDQLTFKVGGTTISTTIETSDDETWTHTDGLEPTLLSDGLVAYNPDDPDDMANPHRDESAGEDDTRVAVELGYTYQQLGASQGDVVSDWESRSRHTNTFGSWVDGDLMPDTDCDPDDRYILGGGFILGPDPPRLSIDADVSEATIQDTFTFTSNVVAGDGVPGTTQWDFGDGATATGATATHQYDTKGTFTVTASNTDSNGVTGTRSLTVDVVNIAPTAAFTPDPNSPLIGATVTFEDASSDPDGGVAAWSWNFGDGTTSTDSSPTHSYDAAGNYVVALTVEDAEGDSSSISRLVQVRASANDQETGGGLGPAASFTPSTTSAVTGQTIRFTDASSDADGSIASWAWDFGDGSTSSQASPDHTYAAAGTYTVSLTVADDEGLTATATRTLTVTARQDGGGVGGGDSGAGSEAAPVADFQVSDRTPTVGDQVTFSDRSSDDGLVVAWSWDFGDGAASTQQSPRHTFDEPGIYRVRLTVTDDLGLTGERVQTVSVGAALPTGDDGAGDEESPGPAAALLVGLLAALALVVRRRQA